ncbi:MAG: hypothetical protein KIS92_03230 [Planctomycetota bacterium]|nr:hypothetical protein [Planctomycetota bacterium]
MTIADTCALLRREMIDRIVGSLQIIGGTDIRCTATDLSEQTQQRVLELGFGAFATELVKRLFRPSWRLEPYGLVAVPKSKGGHRFLTPPVDIDRLWQWALYDIHYPRIKPYLSPCSYGFVRGRSNQGAVRALEDAIRARPDGVLMLADVARCFASLPVAGLLKCLWPVVNDPMAMFLIEAAFRTRPSHARINQVRREFLRAGTATLADLRYLKALKQTRLGIPEGSALSAIACVLYLRPLVDSLVAALPGATVIHYGDNLALWLRPGQERIAESVLKSKSKSLGFETETESVVVPPCHDTAEFLGIVFEWSNSEIRLSAPDRAVVRIADTVRRMPEAVEKETLGPKSNRRQPKPIRNVLDGIVRFVWPVLSYYRDTDIGPLRQALWDAMAGWVESDRYAALGRVARGWIESQGRWDRYVDRNALETDVREWEGRIPVELGEPWSIGTVEKRGRGEDMIVEMLTGHYGQEGARPAQGWRAHSYLWDGRCNEGGGSCALLRQAPGSRPLAAPASSATGGRASGSV